MVNKMPVKKPANNAKGSTLLVVLVLSAVALVVTAGLIYMLTESTKMSGSMKRFKTASEAGRAGAEVMYQLINARADPGIPLTNFSICDSNRLFNQTTGKIFVATANWPVATDRSITIDPDNTNTYDMRFDLGDSPAYRVFVKITDTVKGNTASAAGSAGAGGTPLHKHGVVANAGSNEIVATSYPFIYTIEIVSQNTTNPQERAKLSIVYQY